MLANEWIGHGLHDTLVLFFTVARVYTLFVNLRMSLQFENVLLGGFFL